jgi:membrane protease YdiL (CAAX protease family)
VTGVARPSGPAYLPHLAWCAGFIWCVGDFLPYWCYPLGLIAYVLFVRLAERRSCCELGGGLAGLRQFALGVAVGAADAALPVIAFLAVGYEGDLVPGSVATSLVLGAALAPLYEEPLARGLVLRYLELALGSWWALAISSGLITLLHIVRVPMTSRQAIAVGLLMVSLGAAYIWTRRLWLPLGLHIGFNVIVSLLASSSLRVSPMAETIYWAVGLALEVAVAVILIVMGHRAGTFVGREQAWVTQTHHPATES